MRVSTLLDSFDVVSLVDSLDTEFNIVIDGVDILPENFCSVDSIKSLLKKSGVAE
jgi:acyl carrier protein